MRTYKLRTLPFPLQISRAQAVMSLAPRIAPREAPSWTRGNASLIHSPNHDYDHVLVGWCLSVCAHGFPWPCKVGSGPALALKLTA